MDAEVALEFAVSVEARRVHVCEVGNVLAVVAIDVHAAEQNELADTVVLGVACDFDREVAVHAVKQATHVLRDMVDMRNAGTVNHRIEALPVRLLPRMVAGRRDGDVVSSQWEKCTSFLDIHSPYYTTERHRTQTQKSPAAITSL